MRRLQSDIVAWTGFDCNTEYEVLFGQLLKFIYFGALYDCPTKRLLSTEPQRLREIATPSGGGQMDLMKQLMSEMGGAEGGPQNGQSDNPGASNDL